MPETNTTAIKKKRNEGNSASVDLTDIMDAFNKLKAHCEERAPWDNNIKRTNVIRFAIMHAAKHLGEGDKS
ncbi:MAG: hypothetical protein KZQ94_16140 [Candidatus Thiodiazotropha sp. (ex Troendleina suluensis)]|nr:hypothetical protein [Candidatus Thiodiazotropha sp. (ex Troendleina suluensis)]